VRLKFTEYRSTIAIQAQHGKRKTADIPPHDQNKRL